ncbi:hypothetical protein ES708_09418 [subsurface metagenome]
MRGSLRRFEGLDLEREREIIELKKQLAEAKKEVRRVRERHEPGSRKLAEDCKTCLYRIQVLKQMSKVA